MGQYSTVVSLATENRSCVYTSNIPFLSVTPLFWSQYDLLSLDRNSCCCVAAPQTPYGQEKWTQPTLQDCAPRPLCGAVWPTHQWVYSIYISVVLIYLLHPPDWAHMRQSRFSLWLTSDQSRFVHTREKRDWSKVSPREKRDWSKLSPREKRDWLMWAYFGLTLAQSKGPNLWAFAGTGKRRKKTRETGARGTFPPQQCSRHIPVRCGGVLVPCETSHPPRAGFEPVVCATESF